MYNPLPKHVEIRKSFIHGFGLFSRIVIPKGTLLGVSHISHKDFPDGWIRTPLGGFYNHSEKPNCVLVDNNLKGTRVKLLKTLFDIKADTELTCTYTIWKATPEMKETIVHDNWLGL